MHKYVHKSSVPDSYTLLFIKSYLNVSVLVTDMYVYIICIYVCMHVCTKSFLKTITNSWCVCAYLANKADSDSEKLPKQDMTIHLCPA